MTLTADEVYAAAPFVRTLGVEFARTAPDGVVGRLTFTSALSTIGGAVHGGALMGLADACAAVCASANGAAGALPATRLTGGQRLRKVSPSNWGGTPSVSRTQP